MPLSLLTDEQISYVVAEQVQVKRPDILITSVRAWREGTFQGKADESLLRAAAKEGLTLVTYDQKTIPPVLSAWGVTGETHTRVVFVDGLTIPQGDVGGLVRALIQQWDLTQTWEWKNTISFLRPAR